jgi:Homeodomain-like domain
MVAAGFRDPQVLPGQMSRDTDTLPEVHYGAVGEFDRLPEGYAKVIQPMRKYTDAEEWALNKSMELYGFHGAIVRDQYGRILDGHHRQRVARLRGLGVPHTITQVRDDAHAIEIARALNAVRRHLYTQEQRQELANALRDQGFSYRAIADVLGVGKSTVYRDIFGDLRERDESESERQAVPSGTTEHVSQDSPVPDGTPQPVTHESPVPSGTGEPENRITGLDGKRYPDRKPPTSTKGNGMKVPAQDKQLAKIIELLLQHAHAWDAKHWTALMETIQTLRGSQDRMSQTTAL